MQLFSDLALSSVASLEDLPLLPSLLFLDVVHVGVAEEAQDAQEEEEVTLAIVVEAVGFVPGGEHTRVLVGCRGVITWLEGTLNAIL